MKVEKTKVEYACNWCEKTICDIIPEIDDLHFHPSCLYSDMRVSDFLEYLPDIMDNVDGPWVIKEKDGEVMQTTPISWEDFAGLGRLTFAETNRKYFKETS